MKTARHSLRSAKESQRLQRFRELPKFYRWCKPAKSWRQPRTVTSTDWKEYRGSRCQETLRSGAAKCPAAGQPAAGAHRIVTKCLATARRQHARCTPLFLQPAPQRGPTKTTARFIISYQAKTRWIALNKIRLNKSHCEG
jgi:hypothetical protein